MIFLSPCWRGSLQLTITSICTFRRYRIWFTNGHYANRKKVNKNLEEYLGHCSRLRINSCDYTLQVLVQILYITIISYDSDQNRRLYITTQSSSSVYNIPDVVSYHTQRAFHCTPLRFLGTFISFRSVYHNLSRSFQVPGSSARIKWTTKLHLTQKVRASGATLLHPPYILVAWARKSHLFKFSSSVLRCSDIAQYA